MNCETLLDIGHITVGSHLALRIKLSKALLFRFNYTKVNLYFLKFDHHGHVIKGIDLVLSSSIKYIERSILALISNNETLTTSKYSFDHPNCIFYLYSWITLDTPPSRDTDADTSGKENTQVLYRRPKCPSMFAIFKFFNLKILLYVENLHIDQYMFINIDSLYTSVIVGH